MRKINIFNRTGSKQVINIGGKPHTFIPKDNFISASAYDALKAHRGFEILVRSGTLIAVDESGSVIAGQSEAKTPVRVSRNDMYIVEAKAQGVSTEVSGGGPNPVITELQKKKELSSADIKRTQEVNELIELRYKEAKDKVAELDDIELLAAWHLAEDRVRLKKALKKRVRGA